MKKPAPNRKPLKPILCMNFGPIGDTLIMLALFDDILSLDPQAHFTVITSSNAKMISELASAYRQVEVIEIPGSPLKFLKFIARIFSLSWIILVPGSAKGYSPQLSAFFVALSARPGNTTIGFGDIRKQGGWLPFQKKLFVDIHDTILNNYRRMIPFFMPGVQVPSHLANVKLNPPALPKEFPFAPQKYFLIHMFGTRARLSFPPKRWKIFMAELAQKHPDYGIVLTGGKKDEALIREIAESVQEKMIVGQVPASYSASISNQNARTQSALKVPQILICINKPIMEVASIAKHAAVYVGVDTGVTHLASLLHRPAVIIGNNSNPLWLPTYNPNGVILLNTSRCVCTGDKNDNCRVYEDGVGYHACTYDITLPEVYAAIEAKLAGK